MKTHYQEGNEPTATEMEHFASRYTAEQWATLIANEIFVKNFDKNLDTMAVCAEMLLNRKRVNSLKDVTRQISS